MTQRSHISPASTVGGPAAKDCWYVAALARDVGRTVLMRLIVDTWVILYRRENGEPVALGALCPHRSFPLGNSCLRRDDVECSYHGMTFGPDGRCTRIPWREEPPVEYRLAHYPLVERGKWLWIWPHDALRADASVVPVLMD